MPDTTEEELVTVLSKVLLFSSNDDNDNGEEHLEGLDDDLIAYMAGLLATSHQEVSPEDDLLLKDSVQQVLLPFLESVHCPEPLVEQAETAVLQVLQQQQHASTHESSSSAHNNNSNDPTTNTASTGGLRKLRQGMVSMSSDLDHTEEEAEVSQYLWGKTAEGAVKPMANTLIDGHNTSNKNGDGTIKSSKEKRKQRKLQAEQERQLLASLADHDTDQDESGGLVSMNYNKNNSNNDNVDNKKRDVLVRNVSVSLDNGTMLLETGELKFAYQRRYGLIGENGVGKSTLLKHIASGTVPGFPDYLRVLHVRQEVPSHIAHDMTVMQAVLQSDVERMALLQQEKELLAKLEQQADTTTTTTAAEQQGDKVELSVQEKRQKLSQNRDDDDDEDDDDNKELAFNLKQLDDIYARLQVLSSDSAEARAAMILTGLQFTPAVMQHSKISSLSGGWRMRVALAAALFIEPDLLMLDEPTNHLDLEAVLWLESYLVNYKHTLIVVSHDRGFLNEVCTDIIEFKRKKLTYYRGNFDTYVKLRDENIRNAMRVYQAYQSKRQHMMEFIEKFRANAKRASMVQSRIKAVEKMDADAPEPVEMDQVWRFSIPNSEPLGPPIISINDVSFDYSPMLPGGSKKSETEFLLQKVNFGVDLTSKIAILGKNGQGKTTLLNLIMGSIKPIKGSVSINSGLRIGHFTQHSADSFDLKISAVENLLNLFEEAEDQEIRSFLGRFQIQGNDALKPMMLLSGGQKSRVAFAALAYKRPHVLVIDEGSNHLSMEAVDALVEAIQDFKGGIIVVSHDEYFVSKTCSELWVVDGGKATRFRDDFEAFKSHTAAETQRRVEESVKRLKAANS